MPFLMREGIKDRLVNGVWAAVSHCRERRIKKQDWRSHTLPRVTTKSRRLKMDLERGARVVARAATEADLKPGSELVPEAAI